MHAIADFSNIFALSAGVHIAYGLLWDVRNFPLALTNRLVATLKSIERWTVGKQDKGQMTSIIMNIEIARDDYETAIRPFIRVFVSVAMAVVLYSTAWLVVLSFNPQYKVSTWSMSIWSGIALLPMPTLVITTFAMSHDVISKVRLLEQEFVSVIRKNIGTPS